jgi:hypothetical protein
VRHLRLAKLLWPEAGFVLSGAIACVHAMAGRKDRAARLLTQIVEAPSGGHLPFTSLALIHAALGDGHRALDGVEAACNAHEWRLPGFNRDYCVDQLRSTPRFRAALSRCGISA